MHFGGDDVPAGDVLGVRRQGDANHVIAGGKPAGQDRPCPLADRFAVADSLAVGSYIQRGLADGEGRTGGAGKAPVCRRYGHFCRISGVDVIVVVDLILLRR